MLDRAASAVLLVRSVEESDRTGALLPLGDREHASRDTLRELELTGERLRAGHTERKLRHAMRVRADRLLQPLQQKYPVVGEILEHTTWPAWITGVVLVAASLVGLGLSALDGSRRIDILAFPFLGVIGWNLIVYLALATAWLRRLGPAGHARRPLAAQLLTRSLSRPLQALVRRTSNVHAALGAAITTFVAYWSEGASPMLVQRARRLFHLGSGFVALGLMAGLYLRGIVLRYEAGWDSTFLSAADVRRVIEVVYAVPAWFAGIELPRTDLAAAALRWDPSGHGVNAAPWIHLLAVSLMLYVVIPRALLAGVSAYREWRLNFAPWSSAMVSYARRALGATARGTSALTVQVVPYACELDPDKLDELTGVLESRLGAKLRVEARAMIAYGDEETAAQRLDASQGSDFDARVLVFGLAATPEPENHGNVIRAARDACERSPGGPMLMVVLDESGYAARFGRDASLAQRLDERRRLWRDFVAGYGLEATVVDLGRGAGSELAVAPA